MPKHPWESGVTSLILALHSPPRMLVFPSQTTIGAHHLPLHLDRYLHSPNVPLSAMGRVLFPHPSLIIGAHEVIAHW